MKVTAHTIGSVPCCHICGSEQVVNPAWVCFNPESGLWELETVRSNPRCRHCDSDTTLTWKRAEHPPHLRIRELNDRFRMQGKGQGTILVTGGIQAEGQDFLQAAIEATRTFTAFSEENDPWGEHDFGAFDVAGQRLYFKFDYYADETLSAGSENPANEGMTYRVLTLMLAGEY